MDNMLQRIICRTCLAETSGYKSLISRMEGDNRTLREVISNFTNVDISEGEKYPKHVCYECYTTIFKADEFRKRCLQSETILKNGFLSHTFEELIKQEITYTEGLNTTDIQRNVQVTNNSRYENCLKKNTLQTGDIEIAIVEQYYKPTDNQGDYNCVKEEQDDFIQDDMIDIDADGASISENIENTDFNIDIANLKCDQIDEKVEINTSVEVPFSGTVCSNEMSNTLLLNKKKKQNVATNKYECSVCKIKFPLEVSLKCHIKTHKIKARAKHKKARNDIDINNGVILALVCPKCEEKFTNMDLFRSHLKLHQEETKLNHNYNNIIKLNNQVKNYQCSLCMRKFVRRSSLVAHIKRHEDRAQIKYTCKTCKREFQHKAHLENHVVLVHSKETGFTCDVCSRGFSTQETLESHKERHKADRKHECKECGKSFAMLSTLTEHTKTHTGEKPYLCSVCGRGFSQKNNMTQHMRRHAGLKPFKCATCERGFVSKGELEAHGRKHSGAHPFACDDCGGRFTTSSSLTKHRRIHTGERPYACDLCPMRFTALNTLKNHRRTHTGEKPYHCSHCEKAFTQRNDLVSHIRCHTGERPYVCTSCGQAFRKASALKVHIKIHQKDGAVM